ncbi:MAG: GMC family oxidoreductase N-terminal domain-containing protein [Hyphomicrobiaceae bacterium]
MRRLGSELSALVPHYDAIVVGSGYGGGVSASRLARMGLRVAVLERGREFLLGEFPDTLLEAQREFHVSDHVRGREFDFGPKAGLFDLRLGRDMHVLVGCGLGGTSLINANVSLPPDPRVWEDPAWPNELLHDGDLAKGFRRAERMLRPVPYPNKVRLDKLSALGTAAKALESQAICPPIAVAFERKANHAGVVQPACTLCGDCCSGCNVGAKSTVQMTYLPDAVNHGAQIFTEVDVRHVRKEPGGWRVFFRRTGNERPGFDVPEQTVSAGIVVLAAGSLGSTEILLRSRDNGLPVSKRLGTQFTGNGDVLAFAYNNDVEINAVGIGTQPKPSWIPPGPCIAGLIDLRDTSRLEDGFVIEEGVLPSGLAPLLPHLFADGAAATGIDTDTGVEDAAAEAKRRLESRLLGAYHGAMRNTQTFLVMAHDDAGGTMRLVDDGIEVHWPGVSKQRIFETIGTALYKATAATGGTYVRNPLQSPLFGNNLITVHPLGGCPMGQDSSRGVVNHGCEVFDATPGASGDAVHEGLYVCDGAVMPRSLGVNPLLTISAVSERAMIKLAAKLGRELDDKPKSDAPEIVAGPIPASDRRPVGVEFTERMSGYISRAVHTDYDHAAQQGRQAAQAFSFTVTIRIDDIERFESDPAHTGELIGTAECGILSNEPLDISSGQFNLMRPDPAAVETRRFDYRMTLTDKAGQSYLLHGFKLVRADRPLDLWKDTTTLFVDIFQFPSGDGDTPLARGELTIATADFARQMTTLKGTGGRDAVARLAGVRRFGLLFAGTLFDVYGGIFRPLERHDPGIVRKKRDLAVSAPEVHNFAAADGLTLRLTRYRGGDKGPLLFTHGLGVSSRIFSIDTIETNLLEYMHNAGYDCWLLDYRASIDLPYATQSWTADEVAQFDYAPAITLIRDQTGRSSVQVIAHCYGATTFTMAMLSGLQGVRSAVISQISTDVIVPFYPQRLLAHLRLPSLLEKFGVTAVNARATRADSIWGRMLDGLIRIAVPFQRGERSRSATSNRITALYGQLYKSAQLNEATFEHGLPEMFGEANIAAFKQLARIARCKHLVDADGHNAYLENDDVSGLAAIPICFIHGQENACFRPESTELTLKRLQAAAPSQPFTRHVIPGYGHIDCIFGKNAARDVYPHILAHLEKSADG